MIQKDNNKMEAGLNDIGNSVSRTAKGVYETAKGTYYNGKDVYEGFKYNDDDKIKSGVRNIAKTVAVGALAVGVVDMVDGVDIGDPIGNQNLADSGDTPNQVHQVQPHMDNLKWQRPRNNLELTM